MPSIRRLFQHQLPRAVWRASAWRGLTVEADVPYAPRPGCRLDVLIPDGLSEAAPVVLHIHGGAFRVFSKETHGYPAARYARAGFITLNVNYRLAPTHPYPAAVHDVHDAYAWAVDQVARFGGDPERIVVSGESAGGNLALGLCISASAERGEPWARRVRPLPSPAAAHIAYGFLEVSSRPRRRRDGLVGMRLGVIERDYLGGADPDVPTDYANPLPLLERASRGHYRLPAVLAVCGTWDVIANDSRRLVRALHALDSPVEQAWVRGAVHGFHTLPGRRSEQAWTAITQHARRAVSP